MAANSAHSRSKPRIRTSSNLSTTRLFRPKGPSSPRTAPILPASQLSSFLLFIPSSTTILIRKSQRSPPGPPSSTSSPSLPSSGLEQKQTSVVILSEAKDFSHRVLSQYY